METERPAYIAPATPTEREGLRYIQSCHNLAAIAVLVAVPSLFLAYVLPPAAVFVIVPLALFAVGSAMVKHQRCRCPRCGGLFNTTKYRGRHVWASECDHCGLPLKPPH